MTRDEIKTIELLEYYRSQVNPLHARDRPPAGFWVKEGKKGFVWGTLVDGDLIPRGKEDDYEAAVRASWDHHDKLHGR